MSAVFMPQRTRIDVARYHQMIAAGIFHAKERIELIEGEMLDMAPIGSEHAATVNALNRLMFEAGVNRLAEISIQNSVVLGDISEPQPDLLLLAPRADHYRHAVPGASDVLLLIEVAHSSLHFDRTCKVPLYARFGVAETWIVNLVDAQLEVYRRPGRRGYATQEIVDRTRSIAPGALPEVLLRWGEVLG